MPICSRSRESQPLLDVQPYSLGAPDACDVGHRLEKNLGIPGSCTTVLPRLLTEVACPGPTILWQLVTEWSTIEPERSELASKRGH
jgi:hypothetical protein